MTPVPDGYETPKGRMFWLGLGFAALVAMGVATVLIPELQDTPEDESSEEEPVDQSTDSAAAAGY